MSVLKHYKDLKIELIDDVLDYDMKRLLKILFYNWYFSFPNYIQYLM